MDDEFDCARFWLDPAEERLRNRDKPVPITKKAFELLRLLAENPNRLLSTEEIRDSLWHGIHVTDGLVREYVHDLRRALGDDPQMPRFIETVRGRGYRLIGEIEIAREGPAAPSPAPAASGPLHIAVLPIRNLSGQERWADFCHALGDELITELVRVPGTVVTADARHLRSGEYAAEPGRGCDAEAEYALGGSLQLLGDRVRTNLHLVGTRDGRVIWADRCERRPDELPSLQRDVIARVIAAVGLVDDGRARPDRDGTRGRRAARPPRTDDA